MSDNSTTEWTAPVRLDLPFPTKRRALTSVVLRPGVIDEDTIELFTFGYCYILACALHEASGWPFGCIEIYSEDDGCWRFAHIGVLAPDGRFVDVTGRWEFKGRFGGRCDAPDYQAWMSRVADFEEFHDVFGRAPLLPSGRLWADVLSPDQAQAIRSLADALLRPANTSAA